MPALLCQFYLPVRKLVEKFLKVLDVVNILVVLHYLVIICLKIFEVE